MDEPLPTRGIEERLAALEAAVEEIRDALARTARLQKPDRAPTRPVTSVMPADPYSKPRLDGLRSVLPDRPRDLESWLGRNALLVVGVLALVAALGFTLKYAFDQGWVSPAARVGAGVVAGVLIASYGELLVRRELVRFGAALQGAGAAVVYLAAWGAAGPFQFLPAGIGIAALAIISGLVLLSALRSSEQYLAGLAAAGAYLAPVLLGDASEAVDLLLVYSVLVSVPLCAATLLRRWRATYLVVVVGFFALWVLASSADPGLRTAYLALGGGGLLASALWRRWTVVGLAPWILAWVGLLADGPTIEGWRGWILIVGPAALVWPVWRRAMEAPAEAGARLHADEPLGSVWTAIF
jgi:uncharacterized membrane protein